MEWVETTGLTVRAAKDLALDRLGVDEADAEFDVIEEPTSKLLGLRKTEARVRARVRPQSPRAKMERRPGAKKGRNSAPRKQGSDGGDSKRAKPARDSAQSDKPKRDPRPAASSASTKQKSSRDSTPPKDKPKDKQETPMEDITVGEQAEAVESFVRGVLAAMGVSGETSLVDVDESTVEVHVTGDQLGLLIGPGGRTLSALNELSRTVMQRQAAGARVDGRVFVDVAGYREKRRIALSDFVKKEVARVLADGVDVALEPMSAADRKTVHDTIAEIDGVTSLSEGEDPRRRVVIVRS